MVIEDVLWDLTPEQVAEMWDGYAAGQKVGQLARRFGKRHAQTYLRIQRSSGIKPTIPTRGLGERRAVADPLRELEQLPEDSP